MSTSEFQVGYIARAHGLEGELGVKLFDPGSEALFEVDRVRLRLKDGSEMELTVESVRAASKELLVGLEGVTGRSAAERLVGSTVFVFREDLEEPEEGEFFQGDLIGLKAFDEQGIELGVVEELWTTGPVPNLVIRKEGAEELVVPFADEYVPTVDVSGGRIVIRPPVYAE